MAYQPGSFGEDTVDPLTYALSQGGLRPRQPPRALTPSSASAQPAPVPTSSLAGRGISAIKSFFSTPQLGDPDYSRPLARFREPLTDWEARPFTSAEIEERAGHPGFFHTIGEEVATQKGIMQKIPWFGQLPDATEAIRAWQAAQRFKASAYTNPEDEIADQRTITKYFNETRVRQKMDENRSFMGKAIGYPLRSIPFVGEIMLSNALFRKKGLGVAAGGTGISMSGARYGAIRGLNKLIGGGLEKLIANRMKAYAVRYGRNLVPGMLEPVARRWRLSG